MIGVLFLIIAVIAAWPEPVGAGVAVGAVLVTALWVLFFFPFSRTIWCAIDLAMKPLDFGDDVAPGFELQDEIDTFLAEQTRAGTPESEQERAEHPPGDAEDGKAPS